MVNAKGNAKRHEFRAVIDGIDLTPELTERLDRAVQGAILAEVAHLDLGRRGIANSPLKNIGELRGIWIKALEGEQLKQLGIGG